MSVMSNISRPHIPVLGKIEVHKFLLNLIGILEMRDETIGHSVVVCTEDQ